MDRSAPHGEWTLSPAVVAVCFALALSPLLVDHLLFHPDERHYVDGALQMLQTGDWLTPRTAEGSIRLHKPILAYWFAAAGAHVLSPSPLSIRILFLLAGAATIWWAGRAAWILSGSRQAATFTAILLACHPALILSSTRSLPDVLLSLFLTVSLTGFVTIIARQRADWGPLLTAYVGSGLAIASKGSPAIVFVGFATGYLVWSQSTLLRANRARFAAAALLCALVGGGWFLLMFGWHGDVLREQFLVDQGSPYRFAAAPWQVLTQSLSSVLILGASFGSVVLPAVRPLWRRRREVVAFAATRPANRLLTAWAVLFLGCAACINHVNLRYLLPAAVPLAILLGGLLAEFDSPLLRRNLRLTAWLMVVLLGVLGTIVALERGQAAPLQAAILVAVVVGAIYGLRLNLRMTGSLRSTTVISAAWLVSIFVVTLGWLLHQERSFGYRVADQLQASDLGAGELELTLIGEPAHASRIRICSGGAIRVKHRFATEIAPHEFSGPVVIHAAEPILTREPDSDVRVLPFGLEKIELPEIWQALCNRGLSELIRSRQRKYCLVIPRPLSDSTRGQSQVADRDAAELVIR